MHGIGSADVQGVRALFQRLGRSVTGLWRGIWSGGVAGMFAGLQANLFLTAIVVATTAFDGDLDGAVGGLFLFLMIGTPIALLLGGVLGMIAGGLIGLFHWLDGAPIVFGLTAAGVPMHVMHQIGLDNWWWMAVGISTSVGFWAIGVREGHRFADDALEPPVRIEISPAYWAIRPG